MVCCFCRPPLLDIIVAHALDEDLHSSSKGSSHLDGTAISDLLRKFKTFHVLKPNS